MGKTVLSDRLVNTVYFKPEYRIAPFCFRMKQEDTTLREFLLLYVKTFFRQYIAYCHRDTRLFRNWEVKLEDLAACPSDHKAVLLAKEFIQGFL